MWLTLATIILKFILPYIFQRADMPSAAREQALKQAEKSLEIVDKARAARDAAHADFDKRGGVPDDRDPNLRD